MDKQREAFEKWAKDRGLSIRRLCTGDYQLFSVGESWEAWQAALTSQPAAPSIAEPAQQPESKPAVWIDPQQLARAMDELALLTPVELYTMPNNGTVPLYTSSQPAAQVPECCCGETEQSWRLCPQHGPAAPSIAEMPESRPVAQVVDAELDEDIEATHLMVEYIGCGEDYAIDELPPGTKLFLASQPAAPSIAEKREWISCEERLPKLEDADCKGKLWCTNGGGLGLWDWKIVSGSPHDWGITHWMPTGLVRPEPPEAGNG